MYAERINVGLSTIFGVKNFRRTIKDFERTNATKKCSA